MRGRVALRFDRTMPRGLEALRLPSGAIVVRYARTDTLATLAARVLVALVYYRLVPIPPTH